MSLDGLECRNAAWERNRPHFLASLHFLTDPEGREHFSCTRGLGKTTFKLSEMKLTNKSQMKRNMVFFPSNILGQNEIEDIRIQQDIEGYLLFCFPKMAKGMFAWGFWVSADECDKQIEM